MISIIVAIDKNNAIGKNGGLLCHMPNDLKHFKNVTDGHPVIMGRNTWISLPKKPLANRTNYVISDIPNETLDGAIVVNSLDEINEIIEDDKEYFIIGGGMIYKQFFSIADKLYITHIDNGFEGADTYFPKIEDSDWKKIASEKYEKDEKNKYDYEFAEYIRK